MVVCQLMRSPQVKIRRHCGHFCACMCSLNVVHSCSDKFSSLAGINHDVVRDFLHARPPTKVLRTTTLLLVPVLELRIISILSGQLPLCKIASLYFNVCFIFHLNTITTSQFKTQILMFSKNLITDNGNNCMDVQSISFHMCHFTTMLWISAPHTDDYKYINIRLKHHALLLTILWV